MPGAALTTSSAKKEDVVASEEETQALTPGAQGPSSRGREPEARPKRAPHNHVQTAAERLTLQEPQMPGLHAGFPTLCPLGLPWAAEQAPLVSFLVVPQSSWVFHTRRVILAQSTSRS